MSDVRDLLTSAEHDEDRDDELSMEEILHRQDMRNVLRPAATRLRSGLSDQSYGLTPE